MSQQDQPQTPPKRSVIQARPKAGSASDNPLYAPQRDLAYMFNPAMKEAMAGLDAKYWTEDQILFFDHYNITEDIVGAGVAIIPKAVQYYTGDATVECAADALEKVGYMDVPWPVRMSIHARIGEVLLAGFLVAARDVSVSGAVPPHASDLAMLMAQCSELRDRLCGAEVIAPLPNADRVDKAEYAIATHALKGAETTIAKLREQAITREEAIGRTVQLRDMAIATEIKLQKVHYELDDFKQASLWTYMKHWFSRFRTKTTDSSESTTSTSSEQHSDAGS